MLFPESFKPQMYYFTFVALFGMWVSILVALGGFSNISLFWWHPFFMGTGWLLFVGSAVPIKKRGGRTNTLIHASLMFGGILCVCGGFYAIYQNKIIVKHPHFTSLHSKFGITTIIMLFAPFSVGVLLSPDCGPFRNVQWLRLGHKFGGRIVCTMALTTIFLGFKQVSTNNTAHWLFGAMIVNLIFLLWFGGSPFPAREREQLMEESFDMETQSLSVQGVGGASKDLSNVTSSAD